MSNSSNPYQPPESHSVEVAEPIRRKSGFRVTTFAIACVCGGLFGALKLNTHFISFGAPSGRGVAFGVIGMLTGFGYWLLTVIRHHFTS